jgi:hypothetical protein
MVSIAALQHQSKYRVHSPCSQPLIVALCAVTSSGVMEITLAAQEIEAIFL